MQRSAANCPPLSWTGSVISLFWKQKTDNLRAHVVILDLEYMHICDRQSITLCARQISVCEVLCPTLCLYGCLYRCIFLSVMYTLYNMSMYICICMLFTVGMGVLICSIIVLYLLYWIKKHKKLTQYICSEFSVSASICSLSSGSRWNAKKYFCTVYCAWKCCTCTTNREWKRMRESR